MKADTIRDRLCGLVPRLALVLIFLSALASHASSPDMAPCAECHADACEKFPNMTHGVVLSSTTFSNGNVCEACHGPGAAHATSGDPSQIINPAARYQFGGSELCLTCHKGAEFDDWAFSQHRIADVGCASCHTVHSVGLKAVPKDGPEHCYGCHAAIRAEVSMPSHHPITEGKIACVDCHNPHGGSARLTQENTGRELCFSCHADKEGPFVYEHAPVNEDCMICHRPHGTVTNNLLKQNEPTLCLSCHPMHFHATAEGVDGAFTVPLDTTRNGISTTDGWKRGMLTKCTQCHGAIHGTDLPSQTISTSGNALTR